MISCWNCHVYLQGGLVQLMVNWWFGFLNHQPKPLSISWLVHVVALALLWLKLSYYCDQPPIYHITWTILYFQNIDKDCIQYKCYMVSRHVFQHPNSMSISWCCRMGKISIIWSTRYEFSEWPVALTIFDDLSVNVCVWSGCWLKTIISKYKSLRKLVSSETWKLTIHPRRWLGKADISKSFSCLQLAGEEQRGESSYHYRTAGCEFFQMRPYPKNPGMS